MTLARLHPDDTRARILDAAERAFAKSGFDGAAMKAIAAEAGVAQGLIPYHFSDKEGLYAAVIGRRSSLINAARDAALDAVDYAAADAVEQVLTALLRPPLGEIGGGAAYARIFGALAVGVERDVALVERHYDPTARTFIAAIERAVPGIGRAKAAWGYSYAIGALVAVVGKTGRPERLGGTGPEPDARVLDRLVRFLAAGLRDMARGDTSPEGGSTDWVREDPTACSEPPS